MKKFSEKFKSLLEKISATKRWNTVCHLLVRKLVHKSLSLRKKMIGEFMKTVRSNVLMMIHLKKAHILCPVSHISY